MALGFYGNKKGSTIQPSDLDVFYTFSPSREAIPNLNMTYLGLGTGYLQPYNINNNPNEIIPGLYSLQLPSSVFNTKGFYSLIIKPKQIRATVLDCGSLVGLQGEKGLVFEFNNSVDNNGTAVNLEDLISDLVGYRIDYLTDNNSIDNNLFTIITSANRCELVSNNTSNSTQKSTAYRLNPNGSLLYVTVTPNTISSVNPNVRPFIGSPGTKVILNNTNANPIHLEIELTEYDLQKIGDNLYGFQIRDVNNGVVTWYDDDKNITGQALVYDIKDEVNNPLYQVKEKKTVIDTTQDFNNITSDLQE